MDYYGDLKPYGWILSIDPKAASVYSDALVLYSSIQLHYCHDKVQVQKQTTVTPIYFIQWPEYIIYRGHNGYIYTQFFLYQLWSVKSKFAQHAIQGHKR